MDTEEMISELQRVADEHQYDKLLYDTVIDSNERQQLQNIIDELPELKEDEFRW